MKVMLFTYNERGDAGIVHVLKPYLRDGDMIAVSHANGNKAVNMDVLNGRLEDLHHGLEGIKAEYSVLTAGYDNIKTIASSLDISRASSIMYDYEPGYEPEFSDDYAATLANFQHSAAMIRRYGFKAAAAPFGDPLWNESFYPKWDFGKLAHTQDFMDVQLQPKLKSDYQNSNKHIPQYKSAADKLKTQLAAANTSVPVFGQVSIGDPAVGNYVTPAYAEEARKVLLDHHFAGVAVWWTPPFVHDVLAFLQLFRTPAVNV